MTQQHNSDGVTLTGGPPRCTDPGEVRDHVGQFFRDLRAGLDGKPLPYASVPALRKDGVHFHVDFTVGRFVQRRLIDEAWGRGLVSIKPLGDLPVGPGALDEAGVAGRYLSKYVAKAFPASEKRVLGMHRHDRAQGFQPEVVRIHRRSAVGHRSRAGVS